MIQARSKPLRRVLEGQLCTGCGLCVALGEGAIAMEVAAPGYNRPRQTGPVPADFDRNFETICPGATVAPWHEAPHGHPYWGPYHEVATGHAVDEEVRHRASSGGMISALLIHALRSGLVDAVIHVVADPAHPTRNILRRSTTRDDVLDGAGSRYAPSSPLATVDSLLASDERFAFVGKPCDVSALRQLATIDPRVAERFPLVLSFFCGGIPSHAGADRILDRLGVGQDALASFRYRGDGWPGYATATRHDGSRERMSYAESWGTYLSGTVQFRCKICPDPVGGVADIACADAWHGDERGYPLFEETDGRSLLMVRTEAGKALVDDALRAGAIRIDPVAIEEIDGMQPYHARRKRLELSRLVALVALGQPSLRTRGVGVLAAARRATILEQAKSFLGLVRRILLDKR